MKLKTKEFHTLTIDDADYNPLHDLCALYLDGSVQSGKIQPSKDLELCKVARKVVKAYREHHADL